MALSSKLVIVLGLPQVNKQHFGVGSLTLVVVQCQKHQQTMLPRKPSHTWVTGLIDKAPAVHHLTLPSWSYFP